MNLMPSRLIHLKYAYAGFLHTGISLISQFQDKYGLPVHFDDIGIYAIIPQLSVFFNITCDRAISLFFYSLLFLPAFGGYMAFLLLERLWVTRAISVLGITLLTLFSLYIGDVYIAYFAAVVFLIPWALYFYYSKTYSISFSIFFLFAGFFIGFLHYIRSYSGFGVFLFFLVLYGCESLISWKKKIILFLLLGMGFLGPYYYFNTVYYNAVGFCKKNNLNEKIPEKSHIFWHNVYMGFGFLEFGNKDSIHYSDCCSEDKVKSIAPKVTMADTEEYEFILKNEVINFIKKDRNFVLNTLFGKLGILFLYFLLFANFGIFSAFYFRKQRIIDIAFFVSGSFYSLFGLLVMPLPEYSLGFISCVALWGIVSLNEGIVNLYKAYERK